MWSRYGLTGSELRYGERGRLIQTLVVVTDSIACLTRELMERYRVGVVPVRLWFEARGLLEFGGHNPL